jgi:hypothetical protein
MIEVGKLYRCSEYFLLLFPDKETAAPEQLDDGLVLATATATATLAAAAIEAAYWSEKIDKPVSYCNPQTPLLVLSVKEQYIEVLAGDKVGWIINEDWLNIKEIVNEAA